MIIKASRVLEGRQFVGLLERLNRKKQGFGRLSTPGMPEHLGGLFLF